MHELRRPRLVSSAPDAVVFDDVRWGWEDVGERHLRPVFRRVTFDPTRVVEVHWWSEGFPPEWLAAHGQFAFVCDAPGAVRTDEGEEDLGFLYTVQPFFREGERFRILRGFRRERGYPLLRLVTSLRDRVQRASLIYRQKIEAFKLLLDRDQAIGLARASLRAAGEESDDVRYHTTRRSCVTECVDLLNEVLDVRALPGSKVPPGARALEDALFDYTARSRERRELDDLESAPHLAAARADADDRLAEALERITTLTLADLPTTAPFLLRLDPPDTPQAAALIRALLARVEEAVIAGRWTPSPEEREVMDRLAKEFVGDGFAPSHDTTNPRN